MIIPAAAKLLPRRIFSSMMLVIGAKASQGLFMIDRTKNTKAIALVRTHQDAARLRLIAFGLLSLPTLLLLLLISP